MIKKLWLASMILLLITPISFVGADPDIQEGRWEITTKTEMPGMPVTIPPIKHTQCLTKNDLVPQKPEKGQECKITQTKIDGNTVTWVIQCSTQKSVMKGTGKITYKGGSLDGIINMTLNDPNQGKMNMINHISGRRIGDCK